MRAVGYAFLASLPGVTAFAPQYAAQLGPVTRMTPLPRGQLVPAEVAPAGTSVLEHVLFALKHEGVDLQILAQTVPRIPAEQLRQAIANKPGGVYIRKACYLRELFTGDLLLERPTVTGSPAALFDPDRYVTGPTRNETRWRVNFNGIGTPRYCATVERTAAIGQGLDERILERAADLMQRVPKDVLERALSWAYLEETQHSFAIERESPSPQKATAFAQLLRRAHDRRELSEDYLVDLHAATVTTPHLAEFSYRTAQNWLSAGTSTSVGVTYVPPPPTLARELMDELMAFANGDLSMLDPIVCASVISFGFVYIHPFMDGNGRLSRFLFHQTLCRSGELPDEMMLPVSAAIAKHLPAYSETLKHYSRQVRDRWTVGAYDPDQPPDMQFNSDPAIYRYWNATAAVEFGLQMARSALDDQIAHEVTWLQNYDRVHAAVSARYDVRGPDLANLIVACLNNSNRLSTRKRDRYAPTVPAEVFDFIEQCAQAAEDSGSAD